MVMSPIINLAQDDEPTGAAEGEQGGDQDDAADSFGDMTVDFGFLPFVSVGSTVFVDNNDNGQQDAGEPGIEGVAVMVFSVGPDGIAENGDDELVGEDVTDGNGDYFVDGLLPGDYYVRVSPDAEFPVSSTDIGSTDDPNNDTDGDDNGFQPDGSGADVWSGVVTLLGDDEPTGEPGSGGDQDAADDDNGNMTVDFGFVPQLSIGSTIFADNNNNGIQEPEDDGIPGVTVMVFNLGPDGIPENGDDELVGEAVTDANGFYLVDGLVPGDYYVRVSPDADFPLSSEPTSDDPNDDVDGDDNGLQPDGSGADVWSNVITLVGAEEPTGADESAPGGDQDDADDANGNMTVDFGFRPAVDVSLVKTVSNAEPNIGEVITFTVTVSNEGPNDATGISVEDVVPNGYSGISAISNGGSEAGSVVTWTDVDVAAGASVDLTFDVTVEAPGDGVEFNNIANVTELDQLDTDSEPGNDPDTDGDGLIGSEDDNPNDTGIDPDDEDDADDEPVEPLLLSIGSNVFADNNNNGMRDAGEPGIEGLTVEIFNTGADGIPENADDELVGTAVTDGDGNYFVEGLIPGDYYASISSVDPDFPASSTPTSLDPNDDTDNDDNGIQDDIGGGVWSNVITLSPTDEPTGADESGAGGDQDDAVDDNGNMTLDFGFAPTVSIGSTVFADNNDNGEQDAGEPGIEGVTVEVFNLGPDGIAENGDDELVGTDVTDADGNYFVDGLVPGMYYVSIPTPDPNFEISSSDIATTEDTNNDVDGDDNGLQTGGAGAGVWSNPIELLGDDEPVLEPGSGGNQDGADDDNGNMTVDFGFVPYLTLGSTVFADNNNNGMQDPEDEGIPGVTVEVFNLGPDGIAENADDELVGTAVTDADGNYFVEDLVPGDYYVSCLLYTSPSPRDQRGSRMPSSA